MRLLFGLAWLLIALPAAAETMRLPTAAGPALHALEAACPSCVATGVLPCGTPDVAYGRRFPKTAMQGAPLRAYLLAEAPEAGELRPLLASANAASVADGFAARFKGLRLVVIEQDWRAMRVLAPSEPGKTQVDPVQQACFRDPKREIACCLGDGPRDQGCLPKADPPTYRVIFQDDIARERLSLSYPVGRGEAKLSRAQAGGGRSLYWCHKWKRAEIQIK